ncbi:MAG: cyclase family protein [Gammaproteobacteria bacterium]|nr:cyclase family protein [Gammaproteobacteria bacterium]MDE0248288.1 cyclase family protein [Gammaproteobacteria bacterium]
MIRPVAGWLLLAPMLLLAPTLAACGQAPDGGGDREVSLAQYEEWKEELSNWGRWGEDDEIGALNLITPEKRLEAVALVREGLTLSLAVDANTVPAVDNADPYEFEMLGIGADRISVAYHGMAHTHIDAMAHWEDDGTFYNGYTPDPDAVLERGHERNSVHNLKDGILTRGVLIDIPRLKGLPYLGPTTPVYIEDIEAWEERTGVRVSAGDALFIRTGVWARREAEGPWLRGRRGESPGLHPSVIPWLRERDIAILGTDRSYVAPSNIPGAAHDFALLYLGVHMLDNCDLGALAEAAAERGRWEFLLMAAPLPIPGATGSPLNPIAVF